MMSKSVAYFQTLALVSLLALSTGQSLAQSSPNSASAPNRTIADNTAAGANADDSPAPTPESATPGLWTDPKHAVRVIPQLKKGEKAPELKAIDDEMAKAKAVVDEKAAKDKAEKEKNDKTAKKEEAPSVFDTDAAKAFNASRSEPQYVWVRQPAAAKKAPLTAAAAPDTYNQELSDKIAANLQVPSTATLVESSKAKYRYLITFDLSKAGKISNLQMEDKVGSVVSSRLADDNEHAQMLAALYSAIKKCGTIKPPKSGHAPWNMLVSYDLSSGKLFTACLSSQ
jgi:hypothetical protein